MDDQLMQHIKALTLSVFLSLASHHSAAQIGEIYTAPQFIDSAQDHIVVQNGRVTAAPFESGKPQLFLRHLGPFSASENISYDVGFYTGFHTDRENQFGEFDLAPPLGSSAIQLYGQQAGCMINTWQFDYQAVSGGGPHCAYQYLYEAAEAPRPWSEDSEHSLTFQFFHKLPQFYRTANAPDHKAIGQSSMVVYLENDNGQIIGVLANLYDMRGEYSAFSAHDGYSAFVSAPLLEKNENNQACRFFEKSIYSSSFDDKPFRDEKFFRLHITKENLNCIFDTLQTQQLELPRAIETWRVHSWLWLLEIGGYSAQANASLGGSIRDPYLLSCTDVNC